MDKNMYKDSFGWGVIVWLIGYVLGIVFFAFIPPAYLGWVIMPIGILVSLWVLGKKVNGGAFHRYMMIAIIWTLTAIIFDYVFLVLLFKPADGYYKLDVYLYYLLTLTLPLAVGWYRQAHRKVIGGV